MTTQTIALRSAAQSISPRTLLLFALLIALLWRVALAATNAASFHSDEAIVGIMARHINQGAPIPIFYYGNFYKGTQAYMGSADPVLVALGFRVFGETVGAIRVVQFALFILNCLLILAIWRHKPRVGAFAVLLFGIATPLVTLYTTISLGGYNEMLFCSLAMVALLPHKPGQSAGYYLVRYALIGFLAGLGWWTYNLIVVFAFPIALVCARRLFILIRQKSIGFSTAALSIVVAAGGFFLGSYPWWAFNVNDNWPSLQALSRGYGANNIAFKAENLFTVNVPVLLGVRYPWTPDFSLGDALRVAVIVVYGLLALVLIWHLIRSWRGRKLTAADDNGAIQTDLNLTLLLIVPTGLALFIWSSWGSDVTGRYLTPVGVALTMLVGYALSTLPSNRLGRFMTIGVLVFLIGVNITTVVYAATQYEARLSPSSDPTFNYPNDDDQAVVEFMQRAGIQYGYANYWVAYRLTFVSREAVQLVPYLPYTQGLRQLGLSRYRPYVDRAAGSDSVALVSANDELDGRLRSQLGQINVTYQVERVGIYRVFYGFSRPISVDNRANITVKTQVASVTDLMPYMLSVLIR